MARRLVAADASPLIGLAVADAFDLLPGLFGTVTITTAVWDEVMAGGSLPGASELAHAIRMGWIDVVSNPADRSTFPELDSGEASTIALALDHGSECLILMDEPLGRARARACGIAVTGLAGMLLAAKRAGLRSRIRPYFDRLARSNFRISDEIVRAILEEAGEASA
jgi:predicted nucleic acid-binding protein